MSTPSTSHAIDADASVLMKQGLALMREPGPEAAAKALACFDDALARRRRLPLGTVPIFSYSLSACWLNRAEALMRLGEIPAALDAFDEAIIVLRTLSLDDDPRFVRRSAIAHQNRGLVLHAQGRGDAAIEAFTEAISILDRAQGIADRDYLLATVWLNLANAHVVAATPARDLLARDEASRALALVATLEEDDADAAEVGLKARHVLCHALARALPHEVSRHDVPADAVHDATDLADDGLCLIRRWEQKGVTRFRDLAVDLWRFGAGVYAKFQPHFLPEFLREHAAPDR